MSKHSKSTTKKAIDSAKDPYLNVEAPADNSICSGCEALFHNKHWRFPEEEELKELKGAPRVSCPACKKISDGYAGGYVTIKGDFQKEHKDELITLIKKNEERAMNNNPLDRIVELNTDGDEIELTTTTDKFAQRIGRILNKAYKGDVEYKWSDDERLARVIWTR